MSIISRLFLKIMVALFGRPDHDIIFDTDDEYDIDASQFKRKHQA